MRVTFKAHGSATQGVDTTLAEVRGSEGKKEKGWAKAGKTHALITGKKTLQIHLAWNSNSPPISEGCGRLQEGSLGLPGVYPDIF